jgi:hypothetical protein
MDVSGLGFGTSELLGTLALERLYSAQQQQLEAHTVLYEPAVQAFTFVTTAFDAGNPLHVPVLDRQIVRLRSADNSFEQQRIVVQSPQDTGGVFQLMNPVTNVTSEDISFLATADIMRNAVNSLNMSTDVYIERNRILVEESLFDYVTWDITFLELRPIVGLIVLLTEGRLFDGANATISLIRKGVAPLSGTFSLAIPELFLGPSAPLQFNVTAADVQSAVIGMVHPAKYPALDPDSVTLTQLSGPQTDFDGAGSTTWEWDIVLRVQPIWGVDPNGVLPNITVDTSQLKGGFGVVMWVEHVVVGQAGRRDISGTVDVAVASVVDGVSRRSAAVTVDSGVGVQGLRNALSQLSGVEIVGIDVALHRGWERNDDGFGVHTGYGVGQTDVLNGLGAGSTWLVKYVPAGMVSACVLQDVSSDLSALRLEFNVADIVGTNATVKSSQLRSFSCQAVQNRVTNHTESALRVRVASLTGVLPDFIEYYDRLHGGLAPVGMWRSPDVDSGGVIQAVVSNDGLFGGSAVVVGAVGLNPGFSAADADPSFLFNGVSGGLVQVPFRYVFSVLMAPC